MEPQRPPKGGDPASARRWVEEVTGAGVVGVPETVQSLWSGYGRIERLRLEVRAGAPASVILKAVEPPRGMVDHPRGFGTNLSHQRKLKSYGVEHRFYRSYSDQLGEPPGGAPRVARLLGESHRNGDSWLLLEDLDAAGYGGRRQSLEAPELACCLRWLAAFHARYLNSSPTELWDRGTYWHLATRPDELAAIQDDRLRSAAGPLDERLGNAHHRTIVHGDAKVANFCFGANSVAAVDFQYTGGGIGVQDVAYFLGSCLTEEALEVQASDHLDTYFRELRSQLRELQPALDSKPVEEEWRGLWSTCWADFHRFLVGWAPGHWKLSRYSELMLTDALRAFG